MYFHIQYTFKCFKVGTGFIVYKNTMHNQNLNIGKYAQHLDLLDGCTQMGT